MSTSSQSSTKKACSSYQWSSKLYCFRLRKSIASQFEQLCKRYPHLEPQELVNDLILLGLDQRKSIRQASHVLSEHLSSTGCRHIALLSGPFTEFHGLVFKKHIAVDRAFPVDEAEIKINVYELDDSVS